MQVETMARVGFVGGGLAAAAALAGLSAETVGDATPDSPGATIAAGIATGIGGATALGGSAALLMTPALGLPFGAKLALAGASLLVGGATGVFAGRVASR
jgi:hypothetical protein